MKLKNILFLAFSVLTVIPIIIVSLLLHESGLKLSRESYMRNLTESINVQADYIAQTIENSIISDNRFADKISELFSDSLVMEAEKSDRFTEVRSYLETSADKVEACLLLNNKNEAIYTIGEKDTINTIKKQLPEFSDDKKQIVREFKLSEDTYTLGIVTPALNKSKTQVGTVVSVYNKDYIYKVISAYYEISDTFTYICRENGEIINLKGLGDDAHNVVAREILSDVKFEKNDSISHSIKSDKLTGYYKNIRNSSWYLVGVFDNNLIQSFTNQFVLVYLLIIVGVLILDIILSFYFSQKVVEPINSLVKLMSGYQDSLENGEMQQEESKKGYFETKYLRVKFLELMKTISLVQHNFKGIYRLYQSSNMGDINVDIDTAKQTIHSNKDSFQKLISEVQVPKDSCVVSKFTYCFCETDRKILMEMFENMRDEHLSVTREIEAYTPYLDEKWFHIVVVPMYEDERLARLFIQLRDISNFKKQEYDSIEKSRKDDLTGLYNRTGLMGLIEDVLQNQHDSDLHTLMFIDMNFFKMVNDNFGHGAGDDLLRSIGKRLEESVGDEGYVARFGGDEFVVFMPCTTAEKTEKMRIKINEKLIFPFEKGEAKFVVSASIGVANRTGESVEKLDELFKQADLNMYNTKRIFKENIKE